MIIKAFDPSQYRRATLSGPLGSAAANKVAHDYRLMLGCVLSAILDRYERNEDYHFIDTKFSLMDGRDFPDDDPIRGKGTIYGWIQGRGLEALAAHELWLKRCPHIDEALRDQLCRRTHHMLSEVLEQMERIRAANDGRLFFTMTTEGKPLRISPQGKLIPHKLSAGDPSVSTDIFYVKGLALAAYVLGDQAKLDEARLWLERIDRDVRGRRFASDQQSLDPLNAAAKPVKGRYSHGPYMMGIGAATTLFQCTGDPTYQEIGFSYIEHILKYHVNLSDDSKVCKKYDMWEFVDERNEIFVDESGELPSDPGHATEFVGLAMRFLRACHKTGIPAQENQDRSARYGRILPGVLQRNFDNGFSPGGCGIVKAIDLVSRRVLHPDLPWWSLPETLRAAAETYRNAPGDMRPVFAEIATKASDAFVKHFVRPEMHLMAYQTISERGEPVATIPATPDADPGYHTGVSIIDVLDVHEELAQA